MRGCASHVAEIAERTGARVLVQLDEPSLPAVLAGALPTASGWGTVRSVSAPTPRTCCATSSSGLGVPVVVHCCAPRPPVRLLAAAGVAGIGIDATLPVFSGPTAVPAALDALGEVWDAGIPLLLGLVPAVPRRRAGRRPGPGSPRRGGGMLDAGRPRPGRLGAPIRCCAPSPVAPSTWPTASASTAPASPNWPFPTPTCGLAGATPEWARRAMILSRELGRAFVDPPEAW